MFLLKESKESFDVQAQD